MICRKYSDQVDHLVAISKLLEFIAIPWNWKENAII